MNPHLEELFGPGGLKRLTHSPGRPDETLKAAAFSFRAESQRLQAKAATIRENMAAAEREAPSPGSRVRRDENQWALRRLQERIDMYEAKATSADTGILLIPHHEWSGASGPGWRALYGPAFDELASSGRVQYGGR